MRVNPQTGQLEDDGAAAVDPSLGTLATPLGEPDQAAPELAPEDPTTPVTPTTAPVVDEATLPPPPAGQSAVPGAVPGLGVASQTINRATVTGKIVSPQMRAADADVATGVQQGREALAQESKNAVERARIEGQSLEIERTRKEEESVRARDALAEAARRKADIEAQAKSDQAALQAEAAKNQRGFFGEAGTASKVLWGMSLLFGAGAVRYGKDSAGERLLDKAMDDWTADRQRNLDRLGKQAERSGGRLANFWTEYQAEYQAQKSLKDAAGYAHVADQMRSMVTAQQKLLTAEATQKILTKSAEYDQKAATERQRVVESRAATSTSGGGNVTLKAPVDPKAKGAASAQIQANKDRAETLLDLEGNVVGKALSPQEGAKLREGQAATNGLIGVIKKLQDFSRKNGTGPFGPTKGNEQDLLTGSGSSFLTAAFQSGVLNDKEYARYSAMLKGSWLQSGENAAKTLDVLSGSMRDTYNAKIRSQGVKMAAGKPAAPSAGGQHKIVNGKPAMVYPDGTYEEIQ